MRFTDATDRAVSASSLLAATFSHPSEVLSDKNLSREQKRCVLAAWTSDAFAVEDQPWFRQIPGAPAPIPLSAIMKALRVPDRDDDPPPRGGSSLAPPQLETPAMAVSF
jgi:hypothetical protein